MYLSRCHKRIISIALVLCSLVYFVWFAQLQPQYLPSNNDRNIFDLKMGLYAIGDDTRLVYNNRHDHFLILANTRENKRFLVDREPDAYLKQFEYFKTTVSDQQSQ